MNVSIVILYIKWYNTKIMSSELPTSVADFNPEQRTLHLKEVNLIDNGLVHDVLNAEPEFIRPIIGAISEDNFEHARAKGVLTVQNFETPAEARPWASNVGLMRGILLSREIAVRSIDLSANGIALQDDAHTAMAEFERTSARIHVDKDVVKKLYPSVKSLQAYSAEVRENGGDLADDLAHARLGLDWTTINTLSNLVANAWNNEDIVERSSAARDATARARKMAKVATSLLSTDLRLIAQMLHVEGSWSSNVSLLEIEGLRQYTSKLVEFRSVGQTTQLFTEDPVEYKYIPSNTAVYQQYGLAPETEAPALDPPVIDREQIILRQEQLRQERAELEEARLKAIELHDMPLLEELNAIAKEHNAIVAEFTDQTSRSLRDKGVLGRDSLEHAFSKCKSIEPDTINRTSRVYSRLHDLAQLGEVSLATLTEKLLTLEHLRSQYEQFHQQNPLQGITKPISLETPIKRELAWLTEHFDDLQTVISNSRHSEFLTPDILLRMRIMLGLPVDESTDIDEQLPDTEAILEQDNEPGNVQARTEPRSESPLAQANRLAERLNWVVLPQDNLTLEELVDTAEETVNRRARTSQDRKQPVVEKYRLETLLMLREEYGGTLYRSDERILGDIDNLYFVLRFQHPGDDNMYAVAENPVYGNATYVLREDALPLIEGETVLSAVRLNRRTIQGLGAQKIVHGKPEVDVHIEKVNDRIVKLSEYTDTI
jgi:hypothetical protein